MASEVLKLLEALVSFRTVNDPARGVRPGRECPEFIRETLESWGVPARIDEVNGYYTVHGRLGRGKPVVMLQAHWDVVPVDEGEWARPPFRLTVESGRAYGRGAADDKGNVAAVMLALRALAEAGVEGVYYALTGDEEIGGENGAGWVSRLLESRGELPAYLVNADGTGQVVIVRRRNTFSATVEVPSSPVVVEGDEYSAEFRAHTPVYATRHAAYITPLVDTHPLVAASHYLRMVAANARVAGVEGSFVKGNVVPGWVRLRLVEERRGGVEHEVDEGLERLLKAVVPLTRAPVKPGMYSDYGVSVTPNLLERAGASWRLYLDVRAMSAGVEPICEALESVAANALPEARVKCSGGGGYLYTPPDARIVREALSVAGSLGIRVRLGEAAGASDSRYFSPKGVEAIDFGPIGGNVHGPDEWVLVESLKALPSFYYELARRLAGGPRA
ncbi:M20/M25/M40 family metallo-hydrolase [Stetteria hydrogenophila]